jgi:DNA modification methylase
VPLHASIQEHCKTIGFDNLATIIWHKIANAKYEVSGGGGFLGKPYEPNAVIKNDVEYVLMQRKPGGYRSPTRRERLLSIISEENYQRWFRQIWTDLRGTSHPRHPAPFSEEFAERLVRMFSFVGDTVLDPFMGTGSLNAACARWGRNSIGIELDRQYFELARRRVAELGVDLYDPPTVSVRVHHNDRI